jgi:hypothetical protein
MPTIMPGRRPDDDASRWPGSTTAYALAGLVQREAAGDADGEARPSETSVTADRPARYGAKGPYSGS